MSTELLDVALGALYAAAYISIIAHIIREIAGGIAVRYRNLVRRIRTYR